MYNLQEVNELNIPEATDISYIFNNCFNLISISNFNTSNVINMRSMFSYCKNLTIIPNFDTSIQNDAGTVGNMQDLMINMEPLANKDYTSRYTYDSVLGGSIGHFTNLDCKNDIKVLIITDSFGKAVAPYLAMGFAQIDYVYDADVSGVTPEFIESIDPDVVIMMYYPEFLQEGKQPFSFSGY